MFKAMDQSTKDSRHATLSSRSGLPPRQGLAVHSAPLLQRRGLFWLQYQHILLSTTTVNTFIGPVLSVCCVSLLCSALLSSPLAWMIKVPPGRRLVPLPATDYHWCSAHARSAQNSSPTVLLMIFFTLLVITEVPLLLACWIWLASFWILPSCNSCREPSMSSSTAEG